MNNFEIDIKQWYGSIEAKAEINKYIAECTDQGLEIVEVTTHVSEDDKGFSYAFIFKLKWDRNTPRKKEWDDERW